MDKGLSEADGRFERLGTFNAVPQAGHCRERPAHASSALICWPQAGFEQLNLISIVNIHSHINRASRHNSANKLNANNRFVCIAHSVRHFTQAFFQLRPFSFSLINSSFKELSWQILYGGLLSPFGCAASGFFSIDDGLTSIRTAKVSHPLSVSTKIDFISVPLAI